MPDNPTDARFRVLDCLISRTSIERAAKSVIEHVDSKTGGYVCFSNVHTVVTARKDIELRRITNESLLSVPDGMPLSLIARWRGLIDVQRVPGPTFMPYLIERARDLRHYFYGSTPETLDRLLTALRQQFPEIAVAGAFSPPFKELSTDEARAVIARIQASRPDVIWVGLGAPKQEKWMARYWEHLRPAVLLGVGAAFDMQAAVVPRAPKWMQCTSLEWLYRLGREPRRLARRYLVTNSLFLYYLFADATRRLSEIAATRGR
ncbi:glycosyl transferase [Sulfurifustis variabilis]|uniref:Glycosyl transferase n=1 Tax=Sulfurifustis variabilis TaxID=1675686 RepID=A0A1B4VDI7_9GAMM|nr:glycosyl transferase [Sulfurifustis variabilis]